jgi:flagellar motor protein MotB
MLQPCTLRPRPAELSRLTRAPLRDAVGSAPRAALALLIATSTLAGCASQGRLSDAESSAQRYQRQAHDLESRCAVLEAEGARLREELALYQGSGVGEAAFTADLDQRMAELRALLTNAEVSDEDVTVFEIEGGYGYRLKDSVVFESGSDQLSVKGREVLLSMAAEIQKHPYRRIWVRGHTDSDPVKKPETLQRFPHGNLELSAARAIEVAALLVQGGGLQETRVGVMGLGAGEPVAANDSATNKQKNRRVEIYVVEAGAAESEAGDGATTSATRAPTAAGQPRGG